MGVMFGALKFSSTVGNFVANQIAVGPMKAKMQEISELTEHTKKVAQDAEAVTAAGKQTLKNVQGIGSTAANMAEGTANFFQTASPLTIVLCVLMFLILLAIGFIFFKIYGFEGGLEQIRGVGKGYGND